MQKKARVKAIMSIEAGPLTGLDLEDSGLDEVSLVDGWGGAAAGDELRPLALGLLDEAQHLKRRSVAVQEGVS